MPLRLSFRKVKQSFIKTNLFLSQTEPLRLWKKYKLILIQIKLYVEINNRYLFYYLEIFYRIFLQRQELFRLPDSAECYFCAGRAGKSTFHDFKRRD